MLASLFRRSPSAQLALPFETFLRQGMWVIYNGRIGIVTDFNSSTGAVNVMLVDKDKGENLTAVVVKNVAELRQAKYLEIPKLRRPSRQRGASLGYGD